MRILHLLLSLLFCTGLSAQDLKVIGTIDKTLKIPSGNHFGTKSIQQHIKLLKIQLSTAALRTLIRRSKTSLSHPDFLQSAADNLPTQVQLGMNDVPVLNQGVFGSCVTFATTGAIDAALGNGDYVSQVCQLQLGKYLERNGYAPSGWEGSIGRLVLSQIEHFGIVNKQQQAAGFCGLTEYPQESIATEELSLENYHRVSQNLEELGVYWSPVLDMLNAMSERTDTNRTVNDIKLALNAKDRVTFGILLLDLDLGLMGAVGTHHVNFDTWVLTPEIARDIYLHPLFGGHEMIITGYDDEAVAKDEQGHEHKGLFTLRNSWGNQFGDRGDFYMSYDYFKILVIEAQRIRNFAINGDSDSDD